MQSLKDPVSKQSPTKRQAFWFSPQSASWQHTQLKMEVEDGECFVQLYHTVLPTSQLS